MLGLGSLAEPRALAHGRHRFAYVVFMLVRMVIAAPAAYLVKTAGHEPDPKPANDPSLWAYLGVAAALVLLGGLFAGLTIALMGQDEIYLQVIATSGDGKERKHASKVLKLLKKGKHWVLVTLLLSNVITNETLPIILDRSLGGGWPAVVGSTVLIVIFGEIVPQSVCVRYGLPIGAFFATPTLLFMWLLSPIAWPTAKLLDYLLGEDHGTTYKKTGLKTLITLHRTLGSAPDERLNKDEVTIINAVLDLKDKSVGHIMTPMDDVFTLSADAVLDQTMINRILDEGYSRIPIHAVGQETNFVGMLLVKMLITYDPEDEHLVRDFPLATLPETSPSTSCLDIINFFQEGKSHMVLVSEQPGQNYGAIGVVTLEDVIEELIGEEIVDESDVFVDVHKAIRRMHPAPRFRVPRGEVIEGMLNVDDGSRRASRRLSGNLITLNEPKGDGDATTGSRRPSLTDANTVAKLTRRRSSNNAEVLSVKATSAELREHLKHLGPSNLASRPKSTRINTVKIKPGVDTMATVPETRQLSGAALRRPSKTQSLNEPADDSADETARLLVPRPTSSAGETSGLLTAGREASDGVQALGYGTLALSPTAKTKDTTRLVFENEHAAVTPSPLSKHTSAQPSPPTSPRSQSHSPQSPNAKESAVPAIELALPAPHENGGAGDSSASKAADSNAIDAGLDPERNNSSSTIRALGGNSNGDAPVVEQPEKLVIRLERTQSQITDVPSDIEDAAADPSGSDNSSDKQSNQGGLKAPQHQTRSGSITENVVHVDGVKKIVLETTSSSEDAEEAQKDSNRATTSSSATNGESSTPQGEEKTYIKTHRGNRAGKKHKTAAKRAAQAQKEAEESLAKISGSSQEGGDTAAAAAAAAAPTAKAITAPEAEDKAKGKAVDAATSEGKADASAKSTAKQQRQLATPSPTPSPSPSQQQSNDADGSGDEEVTTPSADGQQVKKKKKKSKAKKKAKADAAA